jgi:hypothetical protein
MKRLIIFCFLLSLPLASQAGAYVVDFNDVYTSFGSYYVSSGSLSDQGLTFSLKQGNPMALYVWDGSNPNSNGTNNLIFGGATVVNGVNYAAVMAVTRTGGGAFDLDSVQMSISFNDDHTSETIYANGSPITLGQGIQTYNIALKGVTEVDFTSIVQYSGTTPYWLMDNVTYQVSAVPLPAALLLFGPGLAGLAAITRRFKK